MFIHIHEMKPQLDELVSFLKDLEIIPKSGSGLEDDYLEAMDYFENFNQTPQPTLSEKGRIAFMGLHELYRWIWSVKDCEEFDKLTPHLKLLAEAVPKINRNTNFLSNVTGRQDDKTNKFIELIFGLFAVSAGKNVTLDDPVHSSNGTNPDVIFDFNDTVTSVACKTLNSNNPMTLVDNIRSAAKQINRSQCDTGYILLNAMNIAEHARIEGYVYGSYPEAINIISKPLYEIINTVKIELKDEIEEIFKEYTKACPLVIIVLHSSTRIKTPLGNVSVSLKITLVDNILNADDTPKDVYILPAAFNNFLHNK